MALSWVQILLPWVCSLWSEADPFFGLPVTAWHPGGSPALPGSSCRGLGNICSLFLEETQRECKTERCVLFLPTCHHCHPILTSENGPPSFQGFRPGWRGPP